MKKSISRTEKRGRGRPPTNPTSIHLTLAPEPLAEVDDWIERQKEPYSRPEAIRKLVDLGLKARAEVPDHVRDAADRAAARSKANRRLVDSGRKAKPRA